MFPQEFVISFPRPVQIFRIKTLTKHVHKLSMERCEKPQPNAWEKVYDVDLPSRQDNFQGDSQQVPNVTARFLKFTVHSAWDDFVSVHVVGVEGRALAQ